MVNFLRAEAALQPVADQPCFVPTKSDDDFAEVHGQQHVKREVEVAAAGAHNLLMMCPIKRVASRPDTHRFREDPEIRGYRRIRKT